MHDVSLFSSSEGDSSDGQTKSGEVLVDNEICVFLRNDDLYQGRDDESGVGEGNDERDSSGGNSGKGNEVVVGEVRCIKNLSPLVNRLLGEHVD